jgi:hypothetical protein
MKIMKVSQASGCIKLSSSTHKVAACRTRNPGGLSVLGRILIVAEFEKYQRHDSELQIQRSKANSFLKKFPVLGIRYLDPI